MNKIKVIDLLNMISKGEELPKTIRWYDKFYNDYDEISNNYKAFVYEKLKNEVWNLNDEVEILNEAKEDKIQKIYHFKTSLIQNEVEIFITETLNQMVDKINELIDEINNLKEE